MPKIEDPAPEVMAMAIAAMAPPTVGRAVLWARETWPGAANADVAAAVRLATGRRTTAASVASTISRSRDGPGATAPFEPDSIGRGGRDCVARALALAAGIPYETALAELAEAVGPGYGTRRGAATHEYAPVYARHGLRRVDPPPGRPTVGRAAAILGDGAYMSRTHATAVVGGVVRDDHDPRRKIVTEIWIRDG